MNENNNEVKMVNVNTPLHWGQKYEPLSVLLYEDIYNSKVEDFGCIKHPNYHFLGASPDGIIIESSTGRYGRMLEIKNIVKNTFETNNLIEVISEVINIQEGKVNVKKCNGKLNFKQNVVAELMAEAITKSLTSSIADSEVLNKLSASTKGDQKTENKGIADIVGTFFDGLAGPMKYAIIASVVCVCLIVVLVAAMALSPAGQKSMTNMSGAAASRFGGGRRF